MPHVIRRGLVNIHQAWQHLPRGPWQWGEAIARIETCFLDRRGLALLVAGVVVEFGRSRHPVVMVGHRRASTTVHLWSTAGVEVTEGVRRLLVQVARELEPFGAGPLESTDLQDMWRASGT